MGEAVGNGDSGVGLVVNGLSEVDSDSPGTHNGEQVLRTSVVSTSSINESTLCGRFVGGELGGASLIRLEEGEETEVMTGSAPRQAANNFLKVDRGEVLAGESFTVVWNVSEPRSANDWIGMFRAGEDLSSYRGLGG